MHLVSSLLFLLGSLDLVLSGTLPRVTNAPQKRGDSQVVLNLGAISNFQKTTDGVPTPAGTALIIYPTDANKIPDDGIYLLLGPDIQKSLHDSVKSDCANVNDPKCLDSLAKVLRNDNNDLVGRAERNWLSTGRGAGHIAYVFSRIVAYLTTKWEDNAEGAQPPPLNFHFPSSALSQINSASAASDVVFKTADSDPSAVSVHVTATENGSPLATSDGPLSRVTADAGGHAKGDIEIDAPSDDIAEALNDFFKKGKCQAPPSKREADLDKRVDNIVDCLVNDFQAVLDAMGINGPLNGFAEQAMQVAQNFPLPSFADQQYGAAFGQAVVLAVDAVPRVLHGIAQPQILPTTIFIYLLAVADYGQTFMQTRKLFLQAKSLLSDKEFAFICPAKDGLYYPKCDNFLCQGKGGKCTTDLMKPCYCDAGDNRNCPTEAKDMPFCNDCGGQNGKCQSGDKRDCRCIDDATVWVQGLKPSNLMDLFQQIRFQSGPFDPTSKKPITSPSCDMNSASDIFYNTFRNGVYKSFCEAVSKDVRTMLAQTVDSHGNVIPPKNKLSSIRQRTPPPDQNSGNGYTFDLEWSGGDGSCPSGCSDSFDTMASSPCGHLGGEQNNMANSVTYDTGCGKYSYKINAPPTPASVTPEVSKTPNPGPVVCNSNSNDYKKCWNPIKEKSVDACINNFDIQLPGNGNMVDSTMKNFTQVYKENAGKSGVTYMANIGWIPGCTEYKTMVVDNPQGKSGDSPQQSISCTDIFRNTYKFCRGGSADKGALNGLGLGKANDNDEGNMGLGGYQDYGCLRYGFYPNNVPGVWGAPPNPGKFWDAKMNICG